MKYIYLIDPIEKLNVKKDSSLMMALTQKGLGHEVYLLFLQDFFITNYELPTLKLYEFSGHFEKDSCYLKQVQVNQSKLVALRPQDVIHMRLDPPVDDRYIRALWMLKTLADKGVQVINDPSGILLFHEKLYAYQQEGMNIPSYVGGSIEGLTQFWHKLVQIGHDEIVLKPIDFFSGIGVEKFSLRDSHLKDIFQKKLKEFNGSIIAQPFMKSVYAGEVRALFYQGEELGSILKVPKQGSFLSNIAQGADFHPHTLPLNIASKCQKISWELKEHGVALIAFDILGEVITEVNITCPGLMVEVSHAHKRNLALEIFSN